MHIVIFGVINSEDAVQKYGFVGGIAGGELPDPFPGAAYHQPYLGSVALRQRQLCAEYHHLPDLAHQLRL